MSDSDGLAGVEVLPVVTAAVNQVVEWLLDGRSIAEIRSLISSQDGLSKLGFEDAFISLACTEIGSRFDAEDFRMSFHMEARRGLYQRALAGGDIKTCLDVLKDCARLEGLYTERRHDPVDVRPEQGMFDAFPTSDEIEGYPVQ